MTTATHCKSAKRRRKDNRHRDKNALRFVSLTHKKQLSAGHHEWDATEDALGRQGAVAVGGGGGPGERAAYGAGAVTGKGGKDLGKTMMARLFRDHEQEREERRFEMHIS